MKTSKIVLLIAFFLAFSILVSIHTASAQFAGEFPQESVYGNASDDLLVWITDYEPTLIRSDLLEENDVNIFAKIRGIQVNPFISIPVINSVSVRPATINKNINIVGQGYIRPSGTINPDDLGWVVVAIKRIPTEANMPDEVDLNLTATISYDFQDNLGFGKKDLSIDIINEGQWNQNEVKYEFWDNAGFLRLQDLTDQYATIGIYDSFKRAVSSFKLAVGQQSQPYFINVYGKRGYVRVTLNSIQTPSPSARVNINFGGKTSESLLKVNSPLFAGSDWKVTSINPNLGGGGSMTIRDSKGNTRTISVETRTATITDNGVEQPPVTVGSQIGSGFIGWITSDTVYIVNITGRTSKDATLNAIRTSIKNKGVDATFKTMPSIALKKGGLLGNIFLKNITAPGYNDVLNNLEAKGYFDSALTQYNQISSGLEVEVRDDISDQGSGAKSLIQYNNSWPESALWRSYQFAKLYDQAKASDLLRKLIEKYPADAQAISWNQQLNNLNDFNYANANVFVDNQGTAVSVSLQEIEIPDVSASASMIVKGIQGDYNEGSTIDPEWYLSKIDTNSVTLIKTGIDARTLLVSVGSEVTLNTTSGLTVKLLSTQTKKEAQVTVSPYSKEGITTTNFSLHVAIEKRGIQLTPAQMQDQIDQAGAGIKTLEKFTSQMGTVITGLKNTCFATYGVLMVKKLFDWSGVVGKARNVAMKGFDGNSGWEKVCSDKIAAEKKVGGTPGGKTGLFYTSMQDCLSANKAAIDAQQKSIEAGLNNLKNLDQYFDKDGNIINSAGLADQFKDNTDVQTFIKNQQYLKNQFGTTLTTKKNIQDLALYDKLKGTDPGIPSEAQTKLDTLLAGYKKQNDQLFDSLQKNVPTTAKSYSDLVKANDATAQSQRTKLLANTLSYIGQTPQTAERIIGTVENGIAYAPSYSNFPLSVVADGNKYYQKKIVAFARDGKLYSNVTSGSEITPVTDLGSKPFYNNFEIIKATILNLNLNGNTATFEDGKTSGVYQEGDFYYTNGQEIIAEQKCTGIAQETQLRVGTFKGLSMPAIVPFGKGWTEVTEYDSSGTASKMTIHVTVPIDNQCPTFDYNAKQGSQALPASYQDVIKSASNCVTAAVTALKNKPATESLTSGTFLCDGKVFSRGSTYTPRTQQNYCEDFFSQSDCNLLYQVCDPVMCPASRCDFGGRFPVSNVVQSGVIGSMLLCAPNFPTPVIAVCLPGVRAGLQSYTSMLRGYQACMQTQLAKGETVGICDEIKSLYWCDLIWKTALSMYDAFGGFYGILGAAVDKTKGGGEYITTAGGLQQAEDSFNYFTSVYAQDTFAKFKALNAQDIGGIVCQRAIYGSIPSNLDVFADISKAESPPQFFGHVEESPYTTATNPPTSHYKIYYHIFAGDDKGIYYRVYLSSPITSPFYVTPIQDYVIDYGYLNQGGYLDKTPDIIAASGYRQLCIDIDGVPHCGFGTATSEMVVQEVSDLYTNKLASSDIKTEDECMFSSSALVSALGGTELLARSGINRICSSGDPNAGSGTRVWTAVGWCDQTKGIKCWLDESSVKGAITDLKIQQDTLQDAQARLSDLLKPGYNNRTQVISKLAEAYTIYSGCKGDATKCNSAIDSANAILKESSPLETDLLDEARFIIGLSYEGLFTIKKTTIEATKSPTAAATPPKTVPIVITAEIKCKFIANITKCISSSNLNGVPANVIIAVAAHESAYGTKPIGDNYFGIKSHTSSGVQQITTEYVNGNPVTENALFQSYDNMCDSVNGFINHAITQSSKSSDELTMITNMKNNGYATDPNWAKSVYTILNGIKTLDCSSYTPTPVPNPATQTTPAAVQDVFPNYTISFIASQDESLDSLAEQFYGADGYSAIKKAADKTRISQLNYLRTTFAAGTKINIKMTSLEWHDFNSKYNFKNNEGCPPVVGDSCEPGLTGLKLAGSGYSYSASDIECFYSSNLLGLAATCVPCSNALDCSDLNKDPLQCANFKCVNQSKVTENLGITSCKFQDGECINFNQDVFNINAKVQKASTPGEKINLYKQIINTYPNTQYAKEAIDKAWDIATSNANYFDLLSEYSADSWSTKDNYVWSIGKQANYTTSGITLGKALVNSYFLKLNDCSVKTPQNPPFCRCFIDYTPIFQNSVVLKNEYNYLSFIIKINGAHADIQLIYNSNNIILASQQTPFNSLCTITQPIDSKEFSFIGIDPYLNEITSSATSLNLLDSQSFLSIRGNKLCMQPSTILGGDYSNLLQC